MFESAIGTALTFIFLFTYIGIRRVAGYAWVVDISVFALCIWLFKGTYAGMMTGMLSGLIITLFLKAIRRTIGYEVLRLKRDSGRLLPRMRWEHVPRS
jgi:Na+(H+)/acetate symporter ActP